MFLTYGKDLTVHEMNLRFQNDEEGNPLLPHVAPKLSGFKDKVYKIINIILNYIDSTLNITFRSIRMLIYINKSIKY